MRLSSWLRTLALGSATDRRSLRALTLVVGGVVAATGLVVSSYLDSFPEPSIESGADARQELELELPLQPAEPTA